MVLRKSNMFASIRTSAISRFTTTNTIRPGYVLVMRVNELVHAREPEYALVTLILICEMTTSTTARVMASQAGIISWYTPRNWCTGSLAVAEAAGSSVAIR